MSNLIQGSKDSVDEEHPGALECQALVSNLVSAPFGRVVSPRFSIMFRLPPAVAFFMSHASPAEGSVPASDFPPTLAHSLCAEDSWTGGCCDAWHLALFPRELGSLLWRVFRVQRGRLFLFRFADHRSVSVRCNGALNVIRTERSISTLVLRYSTLGHSSIL